MAVLLAGAAEGIEVNIAKQHSEYCAQHAVLSCCRARIRQNAELWEPSCSCVFVSRLSVDGKIQQSVSGELNIYGRYAEIGEGGRSQAGVRDAGGHTIAHGDTLQPYSQSQAKVSENDDNKQ